ncbi:hypothetical protein Lalb_Chr12g0205931 [Lupinus albus]|uniref:Uncharacterized protein n=1 Tax=Lupinus albus TaxID=3870 RepID=A0A6A4PNE4_LUPAL|nr:hypothetical protein Lalb_Chr12g0205931 [Lupinus albus]
MGRRPKKKKEIERGGGGSGLPSHFGSGEIEKRVEKMKEGKIGEDEKTKVERRWRNLTASPAATRYDPSWLLTPLLLRFFFDSSKGVSNPYPPIPCFLVLRQWR